MNLIRSQALQIGDTIGVVSPAYPFPTDTSSEYYQRYLKGKKELEDMGFKIKEGKNLGKVHLWSGGTPKERTQDINDMFADPTVKAIIAHDGANDSITILEHLDYETIKANPKPFIGFSNITNIHSALYAKTGLVGFHMGLLTYELGWIWQDAQPENKQKGKDYFNKILTSKEPLGVIEPITNWESWKPGTAQGKLFGGNLSALDSLIGTPYFPTLDQLKGNIFFWELDNSPTYRIERVLTHLKYIGFLDVIEGMIVGKLIDMKPSTGEFPEPSHKEIVLELLKDYDFPILGSVDFGHKSVQIPMPIGIQVEVDSENLKLEFKESAVI